MTEAKELSPEAKAALGTTPAAASEGVVSTPTEVGPEQQKLCDRLFNDPNRRTVNFHISRGDGPATAEQICAEVNKALDQIAAFDALPVEEQMRRQMTEVYENLSAVIPLCQRDIEDWDKPIDPKVIGDIFCALDMSLLTLGNWVRNEDRAAIRAKRRAARVTDAAVRHGTTSNEPFSGG